MSSAMILLLLLSIQTGIQPFLQQKFIAEDIHVPSIVAIQEVLCVPQCLHWIIHGNAYSTLAEPIIGFASNSNDLNH